MKKKDNLRFDWEAAGWALLAAAIVVFVVCKLFIEPIVDASLLN